MASASQLQKFFGAGEQFDLQMCQLTVRVERKVPSDVERKEGSLHPTQDARAASIDAGCPWKTANAAGFAAQVVGDRPRPDRSGVASLRADAC
ncbi:MAG: hypothetical protein HC838_03230 [Spirulinaceae cyanobacterium RM2_2_10]|nr:hypothetical protein [Spirulinaceae cyanobacterium RM2_2_10]